MNSTWNADFIFCLKKAAFILSNKVYNKGSTLPVVNKLEKYVVSTAITSELQGGVLIITPEKNENFCQNFSLGNIFTAFRRISNF